MRRFVSIAFIFLLALRGLLGDAMAMGIVPALAGDAAGHSQMQHVGHDMGSQHAMASSSSDHGVDLPHGSAGGHCASAASGVTDACGDGSHQVTCSACDICHSSFHTPALLDWSADAQPDTLQAERSTAFLSATSAEVAKPPIS